MLGYSGIFTKVHILNMDAKALDFELNLSALIIHIETEAVV